MQRLVETAGSKSEKDRSVKSKTSENHDVDSNDDDDYKEHVIDLYFKNKIPSNATADLLRKAHRAGAE